MRPRISIRGSVRPSVRPSVGPSVRRSVRPSVGPSVTRFFKCVFSNATSVGEGKARGGEGRCCRAWRGRKGLTTGWTHLTFVVTKLVKLSSELKFFRRGETKANSVERKLENSPESDLHAGGPFTNGRGADPDCACVEDSDCEEGGMCLDGFCLTPYDHENEELEKTDEIQENEEKVEIQENEERVEILENEEKEKDERIEENEIFQ